MSLPYESEEPEEPEKPRDLDEELLPFRSGRVHIFPVGAARTSRPSAIWHSISPTHSPVWPSSSWCRTSSAP